jgi:hypothetical protein
MLLSSLQLRLRLQQQSTSAAGDQHAHPISGLALRDDNKKGNYKRKKEGSGQQPVVSPMESVTGWSPHLRIEMWGTRCVWRQVVGLCGPGVA